MSVGKICSRATATAARTETIRVAARRMAHVGVGTLVVTQSDGELTPIGIVTDRDVAIRGVARDLDPDRATVADVMTSPAQSVYEGTPIEEAVSMMASGATRRLIVVDDRGALVGVLSIDDVLDLLVEEVDSIGRLLEKQQPNMSRGRRQAIITGTT